jgi:hypothetical protein
LMDICKELKRETLGVSGYLQLELQGEGCSPL